MMSEGTLSSSPSSSSSEVPEGSTSPQDKQARGGTAMERRRHMPWELTAGGSGSSNQDFDAGGGAVTASGGYYFNEVVELSVRQTSSYSDPTPVGDGAWANQSRAALDLHIAISPVVSPYVGANFGYAWGDGTHDSLMAGPEAGIKFYLKDDAFLLFGAEWEFFFDKDDSLNAAFDDGVLLYTLSLGLRF